MSRPAAMSEASVKVIEGLITTPATGQRGEAGNQAYELLRKAIVRTALPPGTPLSEAEVALRIGMSRTPVREAFRRLSAEGLMVISPQAGTYVAKLDRRAIQDACFIRESLECAAARLATAAPRRDRERLLEIVARQREAIKKKDIEANLRADEELHRSILSLSGHGAAWQVVHQARAHMDRLRRIAIPELKANELAVEQHERIAKAIVRGDADKVVSLLGSHIRMIEVYIERIMETHPEYFAESSDGQGDASLQA